MWRVLRLGVVLGIRTWTIFLCSRKVGALSYWTWEYLLCASMTWCRRGSEYFVVLRLMFLLFCWCIYGNYAFEIFSFQQSVLVALSWCDSRSYLIRELQREGILFILIQVIAIKPRVNGTYKQPNRVFHILSLKFYRHLILRVHERTFATKLLTSGDDNARVSWWGFRCSWRRRNRCCCYVLWRRLEPDIRVSERHIVSIFRAEILRQ